ncbi:bifunctional diguanylate cyclase/phosphodiesterase [Hyphomicrobium sp.]|uniref:bifunctional diguanylate cyclase/phosphodiesterase n=1 Tax=Hyphomicrobium sp. TaxID=82 RepID=UPI002E34044C|nr:EAL domain-containing protein [Hyphomicrobium sp.]HEX2841410.1 EAL domain-containing protein [Hyphomicrobium sp.]
MFTNSLRKINGHLRPFLGLPLEVAAAFGTAVFAAMSLTRTENFVSAIWPANGILLAGLLLSKDRATRLRVAALSFAANTVASLLHGELLLPAVGYSIANSSECLLAFWLLRVFAFKNFTEVASFLKFCAVSGILAPLLPSAWGSLVIWQTYSVPFWSAWSTWFPADSLGLLIVTPVFMLVSDRTAERRRIRPSQLLTHYGLLLTATVIVFCQSRAPLLFLITPFTALIAFQLGVRHTAFAAFIVTALAVAFTYAGLGPASLTVGADASMKISVVQLFCLVNLFMSVTIAAAVSERDEYRRHWKAASEASRREKEKFFAALNSMSHGVCLFDDAQRIVMRSDSFLQIYDLSAEQVVVGQSLESLVSACNLAGIAPESANTLDAPLVCTDFDQRLTNGRCVHVSQRPMPDGGMICTYTDVTTQRDAEDTLRHRTLHDSLTGLPNRRNLVGQLQAALSAPEGPVCTVMLVDVDHFKQVNDTLGHAAGDLLLVEVASRLQNNLRDGDLVARLGGDEFAILAANADRAEGAALAQRLLDEVRKPIELEGKVISIGLSIGISVLPADGTNIDSILKSADAALYVAKRGGRNRFALYEASQDAEASSHRIARRDLKNALSNNELSVVYQPFFSRDGSLVGVEALARWRHPVLGDIPPAVFIPLAERTKLIDSIGDWVLETACSEVAALSDRLKVAVNLSKMQLSDETFVERLIAILDRTGLSAARLELEVTESAVFENSTLALSTLRAIRQLGVNVAIDDFGVGTSSLSCLKELPVDRLKIDRAFIQDLENDDRSRAILVAITSMARALGIRTTAEGVENGPQKDLVTLAGCEELQGYLLGRPGPLEQILDCRPAKLA